MHGQAGIDRDDPAALLATQRNEKEEEKFLFSFFLLGRKLLLASPQNFRNNPPEHERVPFLRIRGNIRRGDKSGRVAREIHPRYSLELGEGRRESAYIDPRDRGEHDRNDRRNRLGGAREVHTIPTR